MLLSQEYSSMRTHQNLYQNLMEALRFQSENHPDRTIYTFLEEKDRKSLTSKTLAQQVRVVAAELRERCQPGDRALLLYPPGLPFISAFLGCLQAGVVAVPLYPPSKNNKSLAGILSVIRDCQPSVGLTTASMHDLIAHHFTSQGTDLTLPLLCTDEPSLESGHQLHLPDPNPKDLAFLQYTSGSTGQPKGVMVTHCSLMHNLEQIRVLFQHDSSSQGVIWLPPYHDMGLIGGILQPLYAGFPVTLMAPMTFIQKPLRWLQAVSEYRATTSGGPNFAYELCATKITPEERKQLDLSNWEVAFNGAEPISADTLERFAEAFKECGFRKEAFYPCYGMAETTLLVSGGWKGSYPKCRNIDSEALQEHRVVESLNAKETQQIVSCGRAIADQEVCIVNPESCCPLADGEVGEIWVSGPSVALGYWNQPEKTEETFRAQLANSSSQKWLRTGDLGFYLNGELFITGRCKDLIIIRGRNYYPQDIEATVEGSHPALRPGSGAAFSVTVGGEERLVVVQEVQRDYLKDLKQEEVIGAIRRAIAERHELQVYAVVLLKTASLPKTTSGKIKRYASQVSFLEGTLKQVGRWQLELKSEHNERSPIQQKIELSSSIHSRDAIQLWLKETVAAQLNILPEEIDVQVSFMDYGLDSFQSATISGELSEWLNYRLPPTLLQEYNNIEALSRYLAVVHDVNHRLTDLLPEERQEFLSVLQEDAFLTDRFNDGEIPAEFYLFEESTPYLEFRKRNQNLLGGEARNPFFTVHSGLNNDQTVIDRKTYINYSCNNFLGLSGHPRVTQAAISAVEHYGSSVSASRLVSGERPLHLELEREIADWLRVEKALVFVGAATANVSTIGHLFGENDLILYDELSHNSLLQGIKLSHADSQPFAHNDYGDLEQRLESMRRRYEKVLIFIEGLYSMDGDIPDLPKFIELKKRYKAWLMVDECLSIGVLGETGRGIGEYYGVNSEDVDIWMGGISKAFASCGGYIAGNGALIEYLKYTAPGFIFTTGLSPANTAAALEAIHILKEEPSRIAQLRERIDLFMTLAREKDLNTGTCKGAPIIPVIIGNPIHCVKIYQALFERGINVQPIFYPAVAANASRLRFSLSATHTEEQIRYTIDTVAEVYDQCKLKVNT